MTICCFCLSVVLDNLVLYIIIIYDTTLLIFDFRLSVYLSNKQS